MGLFINRPPSGTICLTISTMLLKESIDTVPNAITLLQPDDWHLHVRDGEVLSTVIPHTAGQFGRAIIMPNLKPPVTTTAQALAYRERILAAVPVGLVFEPLMTLYLTDNLDPLEIARAKAAGIVAAKLYPAGVTTNSDAGVTRLDKIYPVLAAMERHGMLLLVHGEVTDPDIDLFDREAVFIDQHLEGLRRDFPELNIVFEHITTKDAAQYVMAAPRHLAATLTAHHLMFNRNALFMGGIRPHFYCLPVLKRETHRLALVAAATSGDQRFFLGTDSAPHAAILKEHASGCAGCYTAAAAMAMYAQIFDDVGALDKLEAFASLNGPDFYGLPRNTSTVTLQREVWTEPTHYPYGDATLKPLLGNTPLAWRLV